MRAADHVPAVVLIHAELPSPVVALPGRAFGVEEGAVRRLVFFHGFQRILLPLPLPLLGRLPLLFLLGLLVIRKANVGAPTHQVLILVRVDLLYLDLLDPNKVGVASFGTHQLLGGDNDTGADLRQFLCSLRPRVNSDWPPSLSPEMLLRRGREQRRGGGAL